VKRKASLQKYTPEQLRNGIFALNTRRFGTVAEHLIKILANTNWGKDFSHDLYDEKTNLRIEVKFSRALKANPKTIQETNIIEEIINADDSKRMFASTEWQEHKFDCNIQQIKKKQFDVLYYGIFFSDKVQIFKITPDRINKDIRYSDKQHFGNKGEGQFHLNNATYQYHLKNFMEAELTYDEVLNLLLKLQDSGKLRSTIMTLILSIFP
jgi:hypothetical protein